MASSTKSVCVVGLGRVGLTLATTLASVGFQVTGADKNRAIVDSLREGRPPFFERGLEPLLRRFLNRGLVVQNRITPDHYDVCIICVGTPIDRSRGRAILEHLVSATREAGEVLHPDALVVVRSTVPVGASRSIVLPILEERQERPYLAYCPERTVEGDALTELRELPQIIGGLNQESTDRACHLFSRVAAATVRVASLEAAEMTKLIDNTYRDVNFAFANEVALLAESLGLDGYELIRSANLGYPRNNIPVPGLVGGACLSKDPHILIESATRPGYQIKLPPIARSVNASLPSNIGKKLEKWLAGVGKRLEDCRILIMGIAFKGRPDTDDVRDSPAVALASYLADNNGGKTIYGHDFVVPSSEIRKINLEPCSLEEGFRGADAVVFANNHPLYHRLDIHHLASLMNKPGIIVDAWHVLDPNDVKDLTGITYGGLSVA